VLIEEEPMSMYGPPGGGQYPGQPQDPWQGGGGDPYGGNPYGQPADPYGQPSGTPYGQPGYGQPAAPPPYGQPGYGQPGNPYDPYGQPSAPPDPWGAPQQPMSGPPWGPPPGPPQKNNTGLVVGLAAVAVLVLLIGAVVIFLVVDRDAPTANPQPSAAVSAPASEAPTTEAPTSPPAKYDIDDAEEGDCLFDSNPSDTKASLAFASCDERGEDHYKVLRRFDNTTDSAKCEDVPGYDSSFTSSSGNFVLCVEELL
jgi:hypothetical protein